jgi:hypothetical protein
VDPGTDSSHGLLLLAQSVSGRPWSGRCGDPPGWRARRRC